MNLVSILPKAIDESIRTPCTAMSFQILMATVLKMVIKESWKVDPNVFCTSPAVNDLRASSSCI